MTHPADLPIGWEWAERYPDVYRDDPLPLTRTPCPVCGHPTGDCTQEDHATMTAGRKQAENEGEDQNARAFLQGGRLTAEEANSRADAAQGPGPTMVVVKEDVYRDVEDPGATTKRQALAYHRGQVIPEDEARANKVTAVQQQDIRGGETK